MFFLKLTRFWKFDARFDTNRVCFVSKIVSFFKKVHVLGQNVQVVLKHLLILHYLKVLLLLYEKYSEICLFDGPKANNVFHKLNYTILKDPTGECPTHANY